MTAALGPYRVLDLSTERAWMCAKMLADLGADVIKIEPPGGDPGRRHGPFHGGSPDPERSLRWWFFNRGKRSVTLDLQSADGQSVLRRLAATADVVVESFDPGWLDERGLGYDALAAVNPKLVFTSVTPFGQDGPYAGFAGPDLVLSAMGGPMYLTGDPDRPPVRISVPQYDIHAGAEAAVATMIALHHATRTGDGQRVDVAAQLCAIRTLMNATAFPFLEGKELTRQGRYLAFGYARFRTVYRCADGHVSLMLVGGPIGAAAVKALVGWIDEAGVLPDWLRAIDWAALDFAEIAQRGEEGQRLFEQIADTIEAFFAGYTKAELYDEALRRRFLLAPVCTVRDIRHDAQLDARDYFVPVDHDDLGQIVYPGPWAKLSGTPLGDLARAPHVGEHSIDVLDEELGLDERSLRLGQAGVI